MSDLASEYAHWQHVMARNAGMLSQPARHSVGAGDAWPQDRPDLHVRRRSVLRMVQARDELVTEFYRDAVDTSAERETEGERLRGVWSDT